MKPVLFMVMTCLLSASALSLIAPAHADEHAAAPNPAILAVSATGTAKAAPDIAVLNLAVQSEEKTARLALDTNSRAMAAVLDALRKDGIEERDLQTSNFSIQPRYIYPRSTQENPRPPTLVGYMVSNSLTVRVRDLDNLGAILDRSVTLGVNSGGSIAFMNDNPEAIIEQARKNAVAAAIAKAKTLSEAANVRLGRIVEFTENGHQNPRPQPMARMQQADAAIEAAPPIAAGENSYSVTFNIRWELAQ